MSTFSPDVCLPLGVSTSLVLDAELVAIDRADGNRLKAFQELSTRARGQIAAHQASLHRTAAVSLRSAMLCRGAQWACSHHIVMCLHCMQPVLRSHLGLFDTIAPTRASCSLVR